MLKTNKTNKTKTATFTCEFELKASSKSRAILATRLRISGYIYNACLGEALKRREQMIHSETFLRTRRIKGKSERKELFKQAAEQFGFREYDLQAYIKIFMG